MSTISRDAGREHHGPENHGDRVRFAPSPTGFLHVGSARTALYNWLVARQRGGTFVLRIEDTDIERGREEWVDAIYDALSWLGLDWDEGPYRQSDDPDSYLGAAASLDQGGFAYWCDCTREQLDERNRAAKRPPGYDRFCRERSLGPGPGRALRFKVPLPGETIVDDLIRGRVSFSNADIEDFVLLRSNGTPLFLLSNVVDDIAESITEVIRGEDHLPNTPKYRLLWEALGAGELPRFAHLPMLVNERRQKLSKRRDPVAVEGYREEGYLPEAMCNYLALLGWGPEEGPEVLSLDELVASFSLARVNHSPAFFDRAKLAHFNGVWIRSLDRGRFVQLCQPFLAKGPWAASAYDPEVFERIAPAVQERVATLAEVPAMVDFLFCDPPPWDDAAWAKAAAEPLAREILSSVLDEYAACPWDLREIDARTRGVAERLGRPLGRAQAPIRVALTGRRVGPPLFESIEALGRPKVLERLRHALGRLDEQPGL